METSDDGNYIIFTHENIKFKISTSDLDDDESIPMLSEWQQTYNNAFVNAFNKIKKKLKSVIKDYETEIKIAEKQIKASSKENDESIAKLKAIISETKNKMTPLIAKLGIIDSQENRDFISNDHFKKSIGRSRGIKIPICNSDNDESKYCPLKICEHPEEEHWVLCYDTDTNKNFFKEYRAYKKGVIHIFPGLTPNNVELKKRFGDNFVNLLKKNLEEFKEEIIIKYPYKPIKPGGKPLSYECDLFDSTLKDENGEIKYHELYENDIYEDNRVRFTPISSNSVSFGKHDYSLNDIIKLYQLNPYRYNANQSLQSGYQGVHYILHINSKISGCTRTYGLSFSNDNHAGDKYRAIFSSPDTYAAAPCRWRAKMCVDANGDCKHSEPDHFCGGVTDIAGKKGIVDGYYSGSKTGRKIEGTNYLPIGELRESGSVNNYHLKILDFFHAYGHIEFESEILHDGFKKFMWDADENDNSRYSIGLYFPWEYKQPFEDSGNDGFLENFSNTRELYHVAQSCPGTNLSKFAGCVAGIQNLFAGSDGVCKDNISSINCGSFASTFLNEPQIFIAQWNSNVDKILESRKTYTYDSEYEKDLIWDSRIKRYVHSETNSFLSNPYKTNVIFKEIYDNRQTLIVRDPSFELDINDIISFVGNSGRPTKSKSRQFRISNISIYNETDLLLELEKAIPDNVNAVVGNTIFKHNLSLYPWRKIEISDEEYEEYFKFASETQKLKLIVNLSFEDIQNISDNCAGRDVGEGCFRTKRRWQMVRKTLYETDIFKKWEKFEQDTLDKEVVIIAKDLTSKLKNLIDKINYLVSIQDSRGDDVEEQKGIAAHISKEQLEKWKQAALDDIRNIDENLASYFYTDQTYTLEQLRERIPVFQDDWFRKKLEKKEEILKNYSSVTPYTTQKRQEAIVNIVDKFNRGVYVDEKFEKLKKLPVLNFNSGIISNVKNYNDSYAFIKNDENTVKVRLKIDDPNEIMKNYRTRLYCKNITTGKDVILWENTELYKNPNSLCDIYDYKPECIYIQFSLPDTAGDYELALWYEGAGLGFFDYKFPNGAKQKAIKFKVYEGDDV